MATISFRTRGKKKTDVPIYISFTHGRDCKLLVNSGIYCPRSEWIEKGETKKIAAFKNRNSVQAKMDELRALVSQNINDAPEFTNDWLRGLVNQFHGIEPEAPKFTLLDAIDRYIEYITLKAANARKTSTTKTYRVTQSRIRNFLSYKRKKEILVDEVNISFRENFIHWAKYVENYTPATFLKSLKQIKTVIRYAKRIGFEVDEGFLNDTESNDAIDKRSTDEKPIFLSVSEIRKLMTFEGAKSLENARDWLVISCWTGCRVSDLMQLNESNIHITISGERAIRYTQNKTGDRINAPFHPDIETILKSRNGKFPNPISHQKYNEYIKQVCKKMGFNEKIYGAKRDKETNRKKPGLYPKYQLVTSHIGRRSFATNHYGKLPTEMIMLVTGHDTVKQFLDYVGADPEEHVSYINAFYRNQNLRTKHAI